MVKLSKSSKFEKISLGLLFCPFILLLLYSFIDCDEESIIGVVNGKAIKECDCLLINTTYRCSMTSNSWDGLQYFLGIGKFQGLNAVYHFKQDNL